MILKSISEIKRDSIKDELGRSFKTLRISLTSTCNLACNYCVPDKGHKAKPLFQKLSTQDHIDAVKKIFDLTGIHTVRLTGGEPLLYKDIVNLVKGIKEAGIQNVKLTTNGLLFPEIAEELKQAGLDAVNISLDALKEDTFLKVSRRKNVSKVLKGIDKAVDLRLPVKLNTVVMKGINDHEILPLLDYAGERSIVIRFLELMNMGHMASEHSAFFFSQEEILERISGKYKFYPLEREGSATANYWVTNHLNKFGIISNISHSFCSDCNRLRLDSFGRIFGCLSSNSAIPIMNSLNNPDELERKLRLALGQKQASFKGSSISMKSIGG